MRRVSIALLASLFAMYGTTATAVDFPNGMYWGFNAGIAEEQDSCSKLPVATGFEEQPGCDDTAFGWQAFLGYQFMKWISVEGGYADLGGSDFRAVQDTFTTDTTGWTLSGVVTAPYLEKIGLYATGGAFFWDRDVRADRAGGGSSASSDSGTDYFWGLGLRYPLTEKVGINLEVKNFVDVGSKSMDVDISGTKSLGQTDFHLYTAGLLFRF